MFTVPAALCESESALNERPGQRTVTPAQPWSYHQLLRIGPDLQELCDGVHKALVVEVAHLLNLAVMVPYPGIELFHEPLVSVGLVIINRPETKNRGNGDKREHFHGVFSLVSSPHLSCR